MSSVEAAGLVLGILPVVQARLQKLGSLRASTIGDISNEPNAADVAAGGEITSSLPTSSEVDLSAPITTREPSAVEFKSDLPLSTLQHMVPQSLVETSASSQYDSGDSFNLDISCTSSSVPMHKIFVPTNTTMQATSPRDKVYPLLGISSDAPPPSESRKIRIAILEPSKDPTSTIKVRFAPVPLWDNAKYEALSYVWGDTNVKESIYLNGVELPLACNLESALKRLRRRYSDRLLWIDGLCIDSNDGTERNQQVTFMRDIYSLGSCTYSSGSIDVKFLKSRFDQTIESLRESGETLQRQQKQMLRIYCKKGLSIPEIQKHLSLTFMLQRDVDIWLTENNNTETRSCPYVSHDAEPENNKSHSSRSRFELKLPQGLFGQPQLCIEEVIMVAGRA